MGASSLSSDSVSDGSKGVRIKPLEWGKTSYGTPEVTTVVGVYRINESMAGGWSVVTGKRVLTTGDGRVNFPSIPQAKAAAQADYEQRIRSALDSGTGGHESEIVSPQPKAVTDTLSETMWGEVVFEGEDNSFLWQLDEAGNRDGVHYELSIELSADTFPVGTRLVILEPLSKEQSDGD